MLLPTQWPGQKARLLCKALYRRLAPASERHLDRCLVLADGTIPPRRPGLRRPLSTGRPAGGDVVVAPRG